MTPTAAAPPVPAATDPTAVRWRDRAVDALFVLLLASLAARLAFTVWEPPFDGTVRYDDVRPIAGAYWPMNLYLGGPGYLVSFVTTAALSVFLARGRTGALTLAGAALVGLGGTLFALVITAEALPFAWAATVLPEAQGRALFDVWNAHLDLLLPAIVGGMTAVAIGVLLVLVAGAISGALPRLLVLVGVACLVLFAVLPPDLPRPAALALYLAELAVLATLGWSARRAARR